MRHLRAPTFRLAVPLSAVVLCFQAAVAPLAHARHNTATPTPTPTATPTASPPPTPHPTSTVEFQCYGVYEPALNIQNVSAVDRFGASTIVVRKATRFCNAAEVDGRDSSALTRAEHLVGYRIKQSTPKTKLDLQVQITNALGSIVARLTKVVHLLVPASMAVDAPPPLLAGSEIDHYECYKLTAAKQTARPVFVADAFGTLVANVLQPVSLCVPVDTNGAGIVDPDAYLACYKVVSDPRRPEFSGPFFYRDEFNLRQATVTRPTELCVASTARVCGRDLACTFP